MKIRYKKPTGEFTDWKPAKMETDSQCTHWLMIKFYSDRSFVAIDPNDGRIAEAEVDDATNHEMEMLKFRGYPKSLWS